MTLKTEIIKESIRSNFLLYKRIFHKEDQNFIISPYIKKFTQSLMEFYKDLKAGKKPILLINVPPQHAKSVICNDFLIWLSAIEDYKIIHATFSNQLSRRFNDNVRRRYDDESFKWVFDRKITQQTYNIINFNNDRYISTTTVGGAITGQSADILCIDDAHKGRREADSEILRKHVIDWFQADAITRLSEVRAIIVVQTRWHISDLAGYIEHTYKKEVKKNVFKAIADEEEDFRKRGEALFPELKSLKFLQDVKKNMSEKDWLSLYQQSPILESGNFFKKEWLIFGAVPPKKGQLYIICDTAYKEIKNIHDYNCFVAFVVETDQDTKKIYMLECKKFQAETPEMKAVFDDFYGRWSKSTYTFAGAYIEDHSSGQFLIQYNKEKMIFSHTRTKNKELRANEMIPFLANYKLRICCFFDASNYLLFPQNKNKAGADDDVDCIIDIFNIVYNKDQVDDWSWL